ncbi:cellulase family glycosylhydrolase [Trichocoleus desertorum AS-A10]|uniref:cellulase family glycosylhydrolase n=1 Tax=Trichocoleus desertorum TaxID=1481672 RepID=UPI00329A7CD6
MSKLFQLALKSFGRYCQRAIPAWKQARSLNPNRPHLGAQTPIWRSRSLLQWLSLALAGLCLSLGLQFNPGLEAASAAIALPLSTRGAQIVDGVGRPVLLRGVNWFGIETELHAPHGLWARDYREMLAQIKGLGYNIIRLPFSLEALRSAAASGIDFNIGANQTLQGKSPLEIMDAVIQEAGQQGLLILLDCHQLNDQRIPELWYGDGFTAADWIDTWQMLANRYKNQPHVIGADLKNEPHGRASWGTNDSATDWRLAAERAGNAILKTNPHWLIVVEGVENNVPGQKLSRHWQGGNLEGVKHYPVRLAVKHQLVYSPHEYGPGVYDQPWFSERTFPKNLYNRWETGFHYIATQKLAPVLIGEFGGRQVDSTSKEGIWQQQLVEFIKQKQLSFTYWSWNPNSKDTGGVLQDDWRSIEDAKQKLLSQLLPTARSPLTTFRPTGTVVPAKQQRAGASQRPIPRPTPRSPATSPTSLSPNKTQTTKNQLTTKMTIESDWASGFCVRFLVQNPTQKAVQNWQLAFRMNQANINNSWNGNFNRQGSQYQVTPPSWARVLQPNQTVDLGFCANKSGPDYRPQQVSVF